MDPRPRLATYLDHGRIVHCARIRGWSAPEHHHGAAVYRYAGTLVRQHVVHDVFVRVR